MHRIRKHLSRFRRFRRFGIFFKTFGMAFLLIALLIVLFSALTIPRQKRVILQSIEAQASSLASSIARVCQNATLNDDYGFIVEHSLELVRENPYLLYIIFVRLDGFSLLHTTDQWEQRDTPSPQWALTDEHKSTGQIMESDVVRNRVFHYAYPLKYSVIPWGKLYLGFSLERYDREIRTMYRIMLLLSLACLMAGIVGAYGVTRKLTRPILELNLFTRQIARGNLDARVSLSTNDEIEDLALAFNKMVEALQKTTVSKDFFNNVLENMSESLVVTDSSGAIQMVNPATLALLGYQEHELLAQPVSLLFAEQDTDAQHSEFDLFLEEFRQSSERMLVSKTGQVIPVLFSSAMMQRGERIEGVVCVALDIRTRKEAETNLQLAYKELKDTQGQLVQTAKLASIGELAAGVAHELNQPLMVIRTTAQFLQRNVRKHQLDLETVEERLAPIERNTARMTHIINHLRIFSRQSPVAFSPVNINTVIEDAFLMIGEQLRLRNIVVEKDLCRTAPRVNGDANQLEQVLLNLIVNARDAILDNPDSPPRLDIISRMDPEQTDALDVLIKDSGRGIPSEDIDKIFDPFFTTKDVGKGTGLGLSISYGIMKDHQGDIRVLETGTSGTTFLIRLPATTSSSEEFITAKA